MKNLEKIKLIGKIYLLALTIFSLFRFILFLTEIKRIESLSESFKNIVLAFLMGVRFDIVTVGYIMFLPTLVIFIADLLNIKNKILNKILFWWIFILLSLSILICSADIPFFNNFFSRFSITALVWMENPEFVFKMIFQEPKFILAIIPFLIITFICYKFLKKLLIKGNTTSNEYNKLQKSIIYLLVLILIFIGIRGRLSIKSPIRIGTSYFCNDPFLNQLGLNPVFTFMWSYIESIDEENKTLHLIDENEAIANIKKYLNLNTPINSNPISRKIVTDSINQNLPNVVLIIMEAMSSEKMTRHGNTHQLTPFLDSLSYNSIYFENVYTAGIHTFNGVFSTLFSYPALYRKHPMREIRKYNGIASTLKNHGYSTTYFTTHDGQFDNIEGFLRANGFDNIISETNYPENKSVTTLGVPDDYMFDYSIPIIDGLNKLKNPFFVSFMTASDHPPYYIPEYFKPHNKHDITKIVEYADWSLRKFINSAKQKEWFENTIFVFVADHGAVMETKYDICLQHHHSPLIFYNPSLLNTQNHTKIGGQIDVYPTIMGLLNLPYTNETLGIDLLKDNRQYIFINNDDKIGVLDEEFILIFQDEVKTKLYKYRNNDTVNYIDQYPEKAKEMEIYAKSNMQVYQKILLGTIH